MVVEQVHLVIIHTVNILTIHTIVLAIMAGIDQLKQPIHGEVAHLDLVFHSIYLVWAATVIDLGGVAIDLVYSFNVVSIILFLQSKTSVDKIFNKMKKNAIIWSKCITNFF